MPIFTPETIKQHLGEFYSELFARGETYRSTQDKLLAQWSARLLPSESTMLNTPFTASEIEVEIDASPLNKAPSPDGISFEFYKHQQAEVAETLALITNKCWEAGIIPDSWKETVVVLLLKKGKLQNLGNSRSEDPDDLAPVAYFSHTFVGKQGRKHSTWREACAVYEAVKYFYPYLDSCVNLRIETDCGMVVLLFSHKTTNDADQLAHFKIGLTELGVKKHMISHRKGDLQQTTDWLSQAKDRLWPDKLAPIAGETDDEIVYSIGYLSSIASDIDADVVDDADANADDDPLPKQQYGALVGALHDLPRPSRVSA